MSLTQPLIWKEILCLAGTLALAGVRPPLQAASIPEVAEYADMTRLVPKSDDEMNTALAMWEGMQERIDAESDALEQGRMYVAWGNMLLAKGAAAPLTRIVLDRPSPKDQQAVTEKMRQALEHFGSARKTLTALGEEDSNPDDADPERARSARRLLREIALLESFGNAMRVRAFGASSFSKEEHALAEEAARGLAVARESEESVVSAAAGFWQAYAWIGAGRPDRAMKALPPAGKLPKTWPYDFYGQLVRHRLMMSDQPAVGMALAIQLERHAETWTETPAPLVALQRAARIHQLGLLRHWYAASNAPHASSREHLDGIVHRLTTLLSAETESESYRTYPLAPAVPLLVVLPDMKAPSSMPASPPEEATAATEEKEPEKTPVPEPIE